MKVILYHRDFSTEILPPRVNYEVASMSWFAIGGPNKATIEINGQDAWEMIERLRCPVLILNERNMKTWWGFVNSVTIYDEQLQTTVTLDEFANRIRVTYSEVNVAGSIGEKAVTAWAEDSVSRLEYGKKEKSVFLAQGTSTQAANLRDTLLERWKYPVPGTKISSRSELRAKITCQGWWHTLDWVYYENDSGKESYEESGSASQDFGDNSARQKIAQSFQLASDVNWTAQTIRLRLKREGSPGDNVTVSLCANNSGVPGTVLASASIAGSNLGEYLEWVEFTLSSRVALATSTTYWIVIERSGSISSSNYYSTSVNEDLSYSRGVFRIYNGSSWVARSTDADMMFAVGGVEETTSQLETIIDTAGEFITGTDVEVDSGIYSCPYREGDQYALAEILELLNSGTTNQVRVVATVDENRRVILSEEPTPGSKDAMMTKKSEFYDYLGKPIPRSEIRPGVWMRLKEVVPASADTSRLADMSRFFVESVTYYPDSDRVEITQRDQTKLLNFGGI